MTKLDITANEVWERLKDPYYYLPRPPKMASSIIAVFDDDEGNRRYATCKCGKCPKCKKRRQQRKWLRDREVQQ